MFGVSVVDKQKGRCGLSALGALFVVSGSCMNGVLWSRGSGNVVLVGVCVLLVVSQCCVCNGLVSVCVCSLSGAPVGQVCTVWVLSSGVCW